MDAMGKVGQHLAAQRVAPDQYVPWHCLLPDQHLQRIGFRALGALGVALPATVTEPKLGQLLKMRPDAQGYVHSTQLALGWLEDALAAHSHQGPDMAQWELEPAKLVATCQEAAVRVLLQAGEGGAVAALRVRAVRHPGAHLLLAPMPGSICLLLDQDFGRMLELLPLFLRQTLQDQPGLPALIDVALAWDLAPPSGEDTALEAIQGDSAGAAFACAALLTLAPYAPPELRSSLYAAGELMSEAFMTAAINTNGELLRVGGLKGKASAIQPLAETLTRWARGRHLDKPEQHPIYLAHEQPGQDQLPGIFKPEPLRKVTDVLHHIARRAESASAVHDEALALVLQHPNDLRAAAADFALEHNKGLAKRLDEAPVAHWKHVAVRALAHWEHQGGPLQTEFVPLSISERSGGAWGKKTFANLVQLLAEKRLDPTAFALEGPPGAGKTTLLRHHMQVLAHTALCAPASAQPGRPTAAQRVLPLYLSLASWEDTAIPKPKRRTTAASDAWMRAFVRQQVQRQLEEEGWSNALRLSLDEQRSQAPWAWQWFLDGLNEAPHPENETRQYRVQAIVRALKAEYGMRMPMLMSVREDHMSGDANGSWTWVKVEAWDEAAVQLYLTKRFAAQSPAQAAAGQPTAASLLALIRSLPESARALYTRPMPLAMLCDLHIESPERALPRHPAALYTANLWFNLKRQLKLTRHLPADNPLFRNPLLLSAADQAWLEQAQEWPESPDELPQGGLLLRGLMDQAEAQYWSDRHEGKAPDQRCTVAVPLHSVKLLNARGKPVSEATRGLWLQAAEALGLADAQPMRKGEFRFAHQSWGEFLASVRLLRGEPQSLHRAQAQDKPEAQARWQRIFEQTRAPEAGRANAEGQIAVLGAEAELREQDRSVNAAWGAVPAAVWQRLLTQGLSAPLEEVIQLLSRDKSDPISEARFWQWASDESLVLAHDPTQSAPQADTLWRDGFGGLQMHVQRWADWRRVALQLGRDNWHDSPSGWLIWYQSLWPPFQLAFDTWLRTQPEFADEQGRQRANALLASQGRLGLPPPADTREVLTLALTGLPLERAAAWLAALVAHGDWRAAVPAALLLRPALEPPKPGVPVNDGHWFNEPGHRHPVLQHLRRLLLLRTVDAGAAVRQRLRHGGVLAALGQPLDGLSPALQAHWHTTWSQAFAPGPGVDLRERLQACLWLGELGDNLRYLRWSASPDAPEGAAGRVGICLHPRHWRGPGRPGQRLAFRIGDDPGEWDNAKPEWTVEQSAGRLAAYPVTVMEYGALAGQPVPPELRQAPSGLSDPKRNNPLMPLTGITWEESMALTDWYRLVYADLIAVWPLRRWQAAGYTLELPTEVQREAWARGPARADQSQTAYTHTASADDPPWPLLFNHHATGWHRPNAVGVFSRGLNPWGLDDLAGNVWNWCSNAFPSGTDYRETHRTGLLQPLSAQTVRATPKDQKPLLAVRGGSFLNTADLALASYRDLLPPGVLGGDIGLRWQLSRPISGR